MKIEKLIRHCAPTLANLKTGNMFSYAVEQTQDLHRDVCRFNRRFRRKGVCLIFLNLAHGRALCYLFRPNRLYSELKCSKVKAILERKAYPVENPPACLAWLCRRFREGEDFPHEVGLFLGYPPEDVDGFIENKARNEKCAGTWKVYGDVEEAQKRFAGYADCRRKYERALTEQRCNLDDLIVAS